MYRVRNWEQYQHYKDRNPPWVKLYNECIMSRWWINLDEKHRNLAIVCILVASRHGGCVPNDIDYVRKVGHLSSKPTFDPLFDVDFLERDVPESGSGSGITETETERAKASKMLASRYQSASKMLADKEFAMFWESYPKKVGKKAAIKAWKASKDRPPIESVLAAIDRAKGSPEWTKENGAFIPHPSTWLNQGRWDDEPTTVVTQRRAPQPAPLPPLAATCSRCGQVSDSWCGPPGKELCSECCEADARSSEYWVEGGHDG
jgi:hypothetical protein